MRIKAILQAVVTPEARAVLVVLLDSPRDYSLAAYSLFDKASEAVTDRSLKKENHELFKGVSALYTKRNAIAHRREYASADEAKTCLKTARGAFNWMESLESQ